jgi:hypothetical protein
MLETETTTTEVIMARTLINASLRRKAMAAVQYVLKDTYYDYIPIGELDEALQNLGIVMLQEDNTEFDGVFVGNDSHCLIRLAPLDSGDHENYAIPVYLPYENCALSLSWYRCDNRKSTPIEVIGYVS